jgi:hypothetical protein
MSDVNFTPETYTSQFVPKVASNVPNVEELRTRLSLMAAIPNSGVDVGKDTEAEALNKLAKIGISGNKIPLSENQQLANEYREAAKKGTESELVTIYRGSHDPNLNKLLDAYVVESKIRSQALEMPDHKGEPLKEFPPAFKLVINRVQENVAMMIETGAQLQTNGVKPTEQERLAILTHLENMHGHADSKAISNPTQAYEPTL